MESIIVDLIIIALFVITVAVSTHRGFAKSVMGFAVILCSFLAAKIFGGVVGAWLDEAVFFNIVNGGVNSLLQSTVGEMTGNIDGAAVFSQIPENFLRALELAGVDVASFENSITSIGEGADMKIAEISETIAHPVSAILSELIAYVGLFLIGLLVFNLISVVVIGIFKLPLLRTIDKILGFAAGAVTGFFIVWGFSVIFKVIMGMLAIAHPELLPFADPSGSYLYGFFTGL